MRVLLGFVIAVTALWAYVLLNRTPTWFPMLRSLVLVFGLGIAVVIAIAPVVRGRLAVLLAIAAVSLGLAAPAAYTLSTVAHPHSGAIPTAGPASAPAGRPVVRGPGGGWRRREPRLRPAEPRAADPPAGPEPARQRRTDVRGAAAPEDAGAPAEARAAASAAC